jgi:hypothetical protein
MNSTPVQAPDACVLREIFGLNYPPKAESEARPIDETDI